MKVKKLATGIPHLFFKTNFFLINLQYLSHKDCTLYVNTVGYEHITAVYSWFTSILLISYITSIKPNWGFYIIRDCSKDFINDPALIRIHKEKLNITTTLDCDLPTCMEK